MKRIVKIATLIVLIAILIVTILMVSDLSGNQSGSVNVSGVSFNEVMLKNDGAVPDAAGNFYDWIELYNASSTPADISGMGLSDDSFDGVKYVFPTGTVIPADGYLTVFCSGEATGGLYAPFKISAKDELTLYNVHGAVIQSIALTSVDSGKTLSKISGSDVWEAMDPSPGYPNTPDGIEAYRNRNTDITANNNTGIYINEFMASNLSTVTDINGEYSDWIELYNSTDNEVNLSGFGISDDLNRPNKFVIPEGVTIAPGEYLLIFCSGNEGVLTGDAEDWELHAPFGLRAYSEAVVLSNIHGQILDSVSYTRQDADISMARTVDGTGEFEPAATPTPGYPNTQSGYEAFAEANAMPPGDMYISEVMGANTTILITTDPESGAGVYPDWIELTNQGSEDINLSGYALSDSANNPAKWVFPDTVLSPGEYITVLATGYDIKDASSEYMHTNFGISADGEALFLFDPDGNIIDKFVSTRFLSDMSMGRDDTGKIKLYSTATPNEKNNDSTSYLGIADAPEFDITPGIYSEDSITVTISCPDTQTIYYTTDCSDPTTDSPVYNGGITVSENTVIRALGYRDGYYLEFATISGTYLFTHDDVDHALPVATLVTDPDNLWDYETGIYLREGALFSQTDTWPYATANYWQENWERPASFAIFDDNGHEVFSQNIGLKMSGAYGLGREQKGMALIARDEYGDDRMRYPFFEDRDFTEYKALLLRAGAQDQTMTKFRDEFNIELLKGYDVNFMYQDYKPYVLYLNGEYWGIYYLREKRNRFFVAQHEGLESAENIDLIKSSTRFQSGSPQDWIELMEYVNSHNLNDPEAYAYVEERVDLDSFMDYMICEIYIGNSDEWNVQYYKVPDGKWTWIYYDFCWTWWDASSNSLAIRRNPDQPMSDLFNKLLAVPEWREAFIHRFAELMNTVYEPSRVEETIQKFYNIVEPEIARERAFFNAEGSVVGKNRVDSQNISSYASFESHVARLRRFADARQEYMRQFIQSEFGLSDEYMAEVFG